MPVATTAIGTTAPAATAPKPIFAAVTLRTLKPQTIRGNVTAFDDTGVTIQTRKGPVTHTWMELTQP